MEEEWRDIAATGNKYQVSSLSRVRNNKTKQPVRFARTYRGYLTFNYRKPGAKHMSHVYVHRAVALAFVANPDAKPQVNHMDGNKDNNLPSNLDWVTLLENIKHQYAGDYVLSVASHRGRTCPASWQGAWEQEVDQTLNVTMNCLR